MTPCIHCESTAAIERVNAFASTDGPVLLARWRCRADSTHWWDAPTDAAPLVEAWTDAAAPAHADPITVRSLSVVASAPHGSPGACAPRMHPDGTGNTHGISRPWGGVEMPDKRPSAAKNR